MSKSQAESASARHLRSAKERVPAPRSESSKLDREINQSRPAIHNLNQSQLPIDNLPVPLSIHTAKRRSDFDFQDIDIERTHR